jgi:uncharacterized membrane protein
MSGLEQAGPIGLASFLASLVECVEALTVVVAVGAVRGWRWALAGTGSAVIVLVLATAVFGTALTVLPLALIRFGVGTLLLLFGIRWLRKAVLRAAGLLDLHDEAAIFRRETAALGRLGVAGAGFDGIAFSSCFKIAMLEGVEIVFIVIAVGAGGFVAPAAIGALAALAVVAGLGLALHRPLAMVPENLLKFAVGVILTAFGTFWVGEAMGARWPGGDWAVCALSLVFLAVALIGVRVGSAGRSRA